MSDDDVPPPPPPIPEDNDVEELRFDEEVDGTLPELIPAEQGHLEIGRHIFVRKRKALIVDLDFPNVFWRYPMEAIPKHRSYTAVPSIFEVPKGTPISRLRPTLSGASSILEFTDSDEDDPFNEDDVQWARPVSPLAETPPKVTPAAPMVTPKANLIGAFMRQTPKEVIIDVVGTPQNRVRHVIVAAVPQGVVIEKCQYADIVIENKVSHVLLVDCKNVKLYMKGSIKGVDLMRCSHCHVRVSVLSPTFIAEESNSCAYFFPESTVTLKCVFRSSGNIGISSSSSTHFLTGEEDEPDAMDIVSANSDDSLGLLGDTPEGAPREVVLTWVQDDKHFDAVKLGCEQNGYTVL